MAERRMFAKAIIDSDAFLDMPLSTQALYFHLSMRADDEGFVGNPKKIQRMIGASDDDCRILVSKRFILTFQSGIIVIKHWKIHNYIQTDRFKETTYLEEKAMLTLDGKKAYRDKLTKVTTTSDYERLYAIGKTGASVTKDISTVPSEGKIPIYLQDGRIKVGSPKEDNDSAPKKYVEDRLNDMGALISFSIDPSTYVMTLTLKNESGEVLSTGTVDLPLESMILGASYADGVLTLNIKTADGSMDNNPIEVNISDLISGLVSETTFNAQVDRLDGRIDDTNQDITTLGNEVEQKEIYGFAAFHSEEAETARNYTKGGGTDKKFRELEAESGTHISLTVDSDYKMTVKLLNKEGIVLSSGTVDLPIESLITKATYANGKLTLIFQSGDKSAIDISSLISGLVPETRTINGKSLVTDVLLSAADVGAYGKSETWTRTETSNLIGSAKQELLVEIEEHQVVGYAALSDEAEKARGFIKGGAIDKQFIEIIERIKALENK